MVSKTVIVAFVALCCAQAFAAPHEEQFALGSSYFSCVKDITKAMTLVKDFSSIVGEYKKIFAESKEQKAACATPAEGEATADEAAVKECQSKVNQAEIQSLITETTKVGQTVMADIPKIKKIVDDCFDL